jgi:hypothetical protein
VAHVNKTGMVEGVPHLQARHYAVFDTAVAAKPGGGICRLAPMWK